MFKKIENEPDGRKMFEHAYNIQVGKGRVLWATATETSRKQVCEEGWVLPGGVRTRSRSLALDFAKWIDEQSKR